MSRENVEAVLRGYEALNRGDLEAVVGGMHPDVVLNVPPVLPDSETYHGHEGVRRFLRQWSETFDSFEVLIEKVVDGGDQVLVQASIRGRGKGSGAPAETPSFPHVWTIEGGKALRVEMYPNLAEGMKALGLEP